MLSKHERRRVDTLLKNKRHKGLIEGECKHERIYAEAAVYLAADIDFILDAITKSNEEVSDDKEGV